MTQASLAQIVRVQAQTMGKTLSRLESRGHVTRVRNDLDRRSHMVSISPAGRQVLEASEDIERTLVAGGGLVSEELRSHLKTVIRELGAPRWNYTAAGAASSEGIAAEGSNAAGPAATVPTVPN